MKKKKSVTKALCVVIKGILKVNYFICVITKKKKEKNLNLIWNNATFATGVKYWMENH